MANETDARLSDGGHVVQFYRREGDLFGAVGRYLADVLLDGGSAIVVARPSHRGGFELELTAAGVDIEAARSAGRFVMLDAAATLARVLVDGSPGPAQFDAVVGAIVRSAPTAPVRVYGEMVDLLWDQGNIAAAIGLEELWNDLAARHPFSLFCAYASSTALGSHETEAFERICSLHSSIVGGAPVAPAAEVARRFARAAHAPGAARRFVAGALAGWEMAHLIDRGVLLVAELSSNAVVHAGSDFTVGLTRRGRGVRVSVGDSSSVPPHARDRGAGPLGGEGLRIVNAIAARWGHELVDGGKVVWAELDP